MEPIVDALIDSSQGWQFPLQPALVLGLPIIGASLCAYLLAAGVVRLEYSLTGLRRNRGSSPGSLTAFFSEAAVTSVDWARKLLIIAVLVVAAAGVVLLVAHLSDATWAYEVEWEWTKLVRRREAVR